MGKLFTWSGLDRKNRRCGGKIKASSREWAWKKLLNRNIYPDYVGRNPKTAFRMSNVSKIVSAFAGDGLKKTKRR